MKVTVVVEKASDGYYSCFVENDLQEFGLAGHGKTVAEAKVDLLSAYEDMKQIFKEEGREIPKFEYVYKYDMQSFFNYFSFLNITKVGEMSGINSSLLRQYASGAAMAGEKQYEKIRICVQNIVDELSTATF